ncbi:MAG: DinB family protein, partial [Acidobacteria bacterium]|nr:DinB family protein [Acidobacteriota bacterium]
MRRAGLAVAVLLGFAGVVAAQQRPAPTPAQSVRGNFANIDAKLLEMAKDFPEDKYDFRLKPEMRSFGEVMVHIVAGNIYAAKVARGDSSAKWDELDASKYKTKSDIGALLEKNFA